MPESIPAPSKAERAANPWVEHELISRHFEDIPTFEKQLEALHALEPTANETELRQVVEPIVRTVLATDPKAPQDWVKLANAFSSYQPIIWDAIDLKMVVDHALPDTNIESSTAVHVEVDRTANKAVKRVESLISTMLRQGFPHLELDRELEFLIPELAAQYGHRLFITDGQSSSWHTSKRYGFGEIVLSKKTIDSFADVFDQALSVAKLSPRSVEKRIGFSLTELATQFVYAHELGHEVADRFGVPGWEGEYLFAHPKEALSEQYKDAVAAEQERFAEGIAVATLKGILEAQGANTGATDALLDGLLRTRILNGPTQEALLHREAELGLKNEGARKYYKAAVLGYGLPLEWHEIADRIAFIHDLRKNPQDHRFSQNKMSHLRISNTWPQYMKDNGYDPHALEEYHSKIKQLVTEHNARSERKNVADLKFMKYAIPLIGVEILAVAGLAGYKIGQNHPDKPLTEEISENSKFAHVNIVKEQQDTSISAEIKGQNLSPEDMLKQLDELLGQGDERLTIYEFSGTKLRIGTSTPAHRVSIQEPDSKRSVKVDLTKVINRSVAENTVVSALQQRPKGAYTAEQIEKLSKMVREVHEASAKNGRLYVVYELNIA